MSGGLLYLDTIDPVSVYNNESNELAGPAL